MMASLKQSPSRMVLAAALAALVLLYAVWFRNDTHLFTALLIFAAPPLLLLLGVLCGNAKSVFWAGVFGLMWFCHGVMVAWAQRSQAVPAWAEIVLSVTIIVSSSWPGLQARLGRKKAMP